MKTKTKFIVLATAAALLPIAVATVALATSESQKLARPEGPCDIYDASGAPCVAAHSTTRALYASYNGPLYQVVRASDGKTLDIGVVQPSENDGGGYADAEAQDDFCANTTCWISIIYDQSGKENHLVQAPHGGFKGPAMGGFNNIPIADMAPVTLMGHKVYGAYFIPGMGLRWNDAKGTAVDDQSEGQYWVINGHHYNTGCCFDYGNAETDSRDDGDGTMETTYYGNQPSWYRGSGPGPWIMTDQENNLVGCVNPDPNDKECKDLPTVNWRFVTATADGEPHHWRSMGGDAQKGELIVMYDGKRIQNDRSSYDPMRKQGAILLANGGDNSNGSSGTFYEGAMTAAGTFPSVETNQAIQANVVAAGYNVQRLAVGAADKSNTPNGLQTFYPECTDYVAVTFVNTSDKQINNLSLGIEAPKGWKVSAVGSWKTDEINPGQTVVANFEVRSGKKEFNGDLKAIAEWNEAGISRSETAVEKVRNVQPVTINEFAQGDRNNSTNSFIEIYNSGNEAVNISEWSVTAHTVNIPSFSKIIVPKGTRLEPKSFYVFGLATSGLAVDAARGEETIYVRSTEGLKIGDEITVGTGKNAETHKIAAINAPEAENIPEGRPWVGQRTLRQGTPTTLWQPLPEGPVITIPAGSNNIPVASVNEFKVGGKMAIGYGAQYPAVGNHTEKYEVVTITEVGKPGTQAWLSMDAKAGDTNIKVSSTQNISVGDKIRLDIESKGHGIETVVVKAVGTPSSRSTFGGPLGPNDDPGTGLELEEPLKFDHSSNMPFSVNGTGISFTPATQFDHSSNEPVLALIFEIKLDGALKKDHSIDDAVMASGVTTAGFQGNADQYFGGPAFEEQGNITLRNAKGLIVDAVNYGLVVDPWLGEGFHTESGAGADGSIVPAPAAGTVWGRPRTTAPYLSSGRKSDGVDTDDNKMDFSVQRYTNLFKAAVEGDTILYVNADASLFKRVQKFYIGSEEVLAATFSEPKTEVFYMTMRDGARRGFETSFVEIYLSSPIKGSYPAGTPLSTSLPTPGLPNVY